jgi:hypothetical protein
MSEHAFAYAAMTRLRELVVGLVVAAAHDRERAALGTCLSPETGASTKPTPNSCAASASSFATFADAVV